MKAVALGWRGAVVVCALHGLFYTPLVSATDWYWVNDFGGTWDEEFGGVTSWRDLVDNPGIPGTADNAYLVLPYSLSFCVEESCFTQPVPVSYRSDSHPLLDTLVIESQNMLLQQTGSSTSVDQLHLWSLTEIVGGSDVSFTPPPSFPLPDPPGIFPEGTHIQSAGTNTVEYELLIGHAPGSTGQYELSGTGVLDVGLYAAIGDAGEGRFLQSGGSQTADLLFLGREASGSGTFELSEGNVDVLDDLTVGRLGTGVLSQSGGEVSVGAALRVGSGSGSTGSVEVSDGLLEATDIFVGGEGHGAFVQDGGRVVGESLTITQDEFADRSTYTVTGGTLQLGDDVRGGELTLGKYGSLVQSDGRIQVGVPGFALSTAAQVGFVDGGEFQQAGGEFQVYGFESIGNSVGSGRVVQTDGRHYVTIGLGATGGVLTIGGRGGGSDYVLLGGELGAVEIGVGPGGTGTLWQHGAASVVEADRVRIGFSGEGDYFLLDGSLVSRILTLGEYGGRGRVHQEGGAIHVTNLTVGAHLASVSEPGQYNAFGGSLSAGLLAVGRDPGAEGRFRQFGGETDVSGDETIGVQGIASYEQYSSRHTVLGSLVIGDQVEARGTYELGAVWIFDPERWDPSASRLEVRGDVIVARQGRGTFNHENGTHVVFGDLIVAQNPGSRGTYNLSGGMLAAERIENNGTINYSGGSLWAPGGLTNDGQLNLSGEGTRTVGADVVNHGTVKVTDTSVTWLGTFTNAGVYDTDPSVNRFADLIINSAGYLLGGAGDQFLIAGDFLNSSSQSTLWNTADAFLGFTGAGDHDFLLAGMDRGSGSVGYLDNFAWDALFLGIDDILRLGDGNNTPGAALYVDAFLLENDDLGLLGNLFGNGYNIYYRAIDPRNAYLSGRSYALGGGGFLTPTRPGPSVPLPGTLALLGLGLAGLGGVRNRQLPLSDGLSRFGGETGSYQCAHPHLDLPCRPGTGPDWIVWGGR